MKYIILIQFLFFTLISHAQKENDFLFKEYGISFNQKAFSSGFSNSGFGFNIRHYNSKRSEKTISLFYGAEYNLTRQSRNLINPIPSTSGIIELSEVQMSFHSFTIPLGLNVNIERSWSLKISLELGAYLDLYFLSKLKATQKITSYELQNNIWTTVTRIELVNKKQQFSYLNGGISLGVKFELPKERYGFSLRPEFRYAPRDIYEFDLVETSYLTMNVAILIK